MKVIKIIWFLSVIILFFFNMMFEGYRIYDLLSGNYSYEEMVLDDYSINSSSRRKSITVKGKINDEKVYFSRFDGEINKLNSIYLSILSNNVSSRSIKVLKFKHSNKVMLIEDSEFIYWKRYIILSGSFILLSMIYFLFNFLKKQ